MTEVHTTGKILLTLMLFLVLFMSCKRTDEKRGPQKTIHSENVLARVDGEPVFESDVVRRIKAARGDVEKIRQDANRWQMLIESAVESEIIDMLLLREAVSKGIAIDQKTIDENFMKTQEMMGEDAFHKMLGERDASAEEYKNFLKERMMIDTYKKELFKDITVDDNTVDIYYEGHKESFIEPEGVRLEIITVESREEGDMIYRRIQNGEEFGTIFQEYASKEKDRAIRTIWMPYDAIPLELQPRVIAGDAGTVLEPSKVKDKFHVVKILEKRTARTLTLEEARAEIKNYFIIREQQDILERWFKEAQQNVHIEYVR